MRLRPWVLGAGSLLAATALLAHDMFLKLDAYFLAPHTAVRIPVINGTFAQTEAAVDPQRLLDISLVTPVRRARIPQTMWTVDDKQSWLAIRTGGAGTYVVGASVRPSRIELTGSDFNAYLKEDGILDVLEARTRDGQLAKGARERYSKHVKAIFQVGEVRSENYGVVLGYPAEIVPLVNPYSLGRGSELGVRCLVDGHPVARQMVLWGGEGPSGPIPERMLRTDAGGIARVKLDAPGRWYVKFVSMVPVGEPDLDYESKWATLTFEMK